MTGATRVTACGVFDSRSQAEQAIDELRRAGFAADQIGFLGRTTEGHEVVPPVDPKEVRADEGAGVGVTAGGILGALAGGAAALTIPGVGPVLAAGILAGVLGGGAVGAWGGGLIGSLVGMALPEDRARYYEEELEAGRCLVLVRTEDRQPEATAILTRHGARLEPAPVSS